MLFKTFTFHFVFVYFEGQKLVQFLVRKMRIEHTANAIYEGKTYGKCNKCNMALFN